MARKRESKWNIEYITDGEIYETIRYLEPDSASINKPEVQSTDMLDNDTVFVICVSLLLLLLGCVGFAFLYYR